MKKIIHKSSGQTYQQSIKNEYQQYYKYRGVSTESPKRIINA